ncbi:MAG: flagellar biosynthetic protein FliR [Oscillospiraceae bacterium]|nr:flagellar biosynthetic protein FliR [Oscillospiraceae bacterium]
MVDWQELTLFIYVTARMSGFVLFNPLLGRYSIPALFRAGLILVLSVCAAPFASVPETVPTVLVELVVKILLELAIGYLAGLLMHIFFYIPILAGEVIDTQMGMAMAKTYDAGSQTSSTVLSVFFNLMMNLLFFAANGHHTLLRILITSGELVPYGTIALGENVISLILELFIECTLLAVKLALPILGAQLMSQAGMGILMKAIPQINIFAINIELKIIIGLALVYALITPFSEFLLEVEMDMLMQLRRLLLLAQ